MTKHTHHSASPLRDEADPAHQEVDAIALGRRVRHLRKSLGLTLGELGDRIGTAGSHLSLLENGRRTPTLPVLARLAAALETTPADLLEGGAPNRRAALEIDVERAQRSRLYQSLGLPTLRVGPRTPTDTLEAVRGLYMELERRLDEQLATPEEARRANTELRTEMRECNNHYPELEQEARTLLGAVGHSTGPLSQNVAADIAAHVGFSLRMVPDVPHSTRSVTDTRNRRIYISRHLGPDVDPRSVLLQALGHYILGHRKPKDYADFLRQRVRTNYFAAALLMPETAAVTFLREAKSRREVSVDDLRDTFAVSYESAAHRFTNLATEHLGLTCHFQKVHESGIIHKGYENDGVGFPADHTGAIEGQPACRHWASRTVFEASDGFRSYYQYTDAPSGTFWCAARIEATSSGRYALSVGVPFEHAKWFRGKETTARETSRCPDPLCCRLPPADLASAWEEHSWPTSRANAHLLAAMPQGAFPGVDETEVYAFLQRHQGEL